MGKQVLKKCLRRKPQSENKMRTSTPLYSLSFHSDNSIPEWALGKVNRPKSSVNQARERRKTHRRSRGLVETLVDRTRGLSPAMWVGRTVIGSRQSEQMKFSRVSLDS